MKRLDIAIRLQWFINERLKGYDWPAPFPTAVLADAIVEALRLYDAERPKVQ